MNYSKLEEPVEKPVEKPNVKQKAGGAMGGVQQANKTIVLFDGECGLCSRLVQFIIRRDPQEQFLFSPLQSKAAEQIWQQYYEGGDGLQAAESDSFAILHHDKLYYKSAAALQVVRRLRGCWPLLTVLYLVPPFIRNFVYDWIAVRRKQWRVSAACEWNPDLAQAYHKRLLDDSVVGLK